MNIEIIDNHDIFALQVFCSKCIKNKIYVPYRQKEEEVCGNCFEILEKQNPPEETLVRRFVIISKTTPVPYWFLHHVSRAN